MSKKHTVQLVQFNNKYGSQVYLPYSIGVLSSYVEADNELLKKFEFKEFIFIIEKLPKLVKQVGEVDILGISCYNWNWELSLKLAEEVKKVNPNCLIILGGPQVPDKIENFFQKYSFIDVVVHGEGEITFHEILKNYSSQNFDSIKGIPGTTFFDRKNNTTIDSYKREVIQNLDIIPSPYLTGAFDNLLNNKEYSWMITWETNRGCPFKCAFCDWGSATESKVRKFDNDRLLKELDYFAEKKVELIFGADANFGIFKRDKDYAFRMTENKKKFGYPKQFRVCFTKNSTDKVFELSKIFDSAGMNKGVSISMQSLNSQTLENIQRTNIKMEFFNELQKRYNENGLTTYTELILPLPGETYDSFVEGIDLLLDNSQHSGIVVYNCVIMPNAKMGSNQYQQEFGLKSMEIPIFQAHSDLKKDFNIIEKEKIVVGTKTMNEKDYVKSFKYSWIIQSMHMLGILQVIAITLKYNFDIKYSEFYKGIIDFGELNPDTILGQELQSVDELLNGVFNGNGFDQEVSEFESISWPPEEATYLRISEKIDVFYTEIKNFLFKKYSNFFNRNEILKEMFSYQKARNVRFDNQTSKKISLSYDIHNFFENCKVGIINKLEKKNNIIITNPNTSFENKKDFSREIVWYGRKGGKFFHPIKNINNAL